LFKPEEPIPGAQVGVTINFDHQSDNLLRQVSMV
jgi:hypothetical protein